jgi:broad specificity polyphosphatase/5'/3'-nucleotidase SurE
VAAAIEGALWGLPAVAASMHIEPTAFEAVSRSHGETSGSVRAALEACATHTARIVQLAVHEGQPGQIVHNVNGPIGCTPDTPVEQTRLGLRRMPSLFARDAEGNCRFRFAPPTRVDARQDTDDRCVLERGNVSHSRIDLAAWSG